MEKVVTSIYFTKDAGKRGNERVDRVEDGEVNVKECRDVKRKRSKKSVVRCDKRVIKEHSRDVGEEAEIGNLTALEKQFIKIKDENPDVILLIETGYLFRLFREDAQVVAKELRFRLSPGHNLVTTSFPFQNLAVHIRHLAGRGYKVGVVRKTESGLMRANSADPNDIFRRELTALYTNSTLVGEDVDISFSDGDNVKIKSRNCYNEAASYLMSFYELPISGLKVRIGVVAVCVLSGDFVYDNFVDDDNRCLVQSCLDRVGPVEILLPKLTVSDVTLNLINARNHMCAQRVELLDDDHFRLENVDEILKQLFLQLDCHKYVADADELVNYVMSLPPPVICALRAMITYLKAFQLQHIFALIKQMRLISSKVDCMPLDSNTIRSLELVQCNRGRCFEGSLLHVMDHTATPFGSRLLRHWMCHPLTSISQIDQRLNTVECLVNSEFDFVASLKKMLPTFPDLESGITLIYNKRSSTKLYWKTINSFIHIRSLVIVALNEIETKSRDLYVEQLLMGICNLTSNVEGLLANLNGDAACEGDKSNLFNDYTSFPNLLLAAEEIDKVKQMLDTCLLTIANTFNGPDITFGAFYDKKYVIMVKPTAEHLIPSDWLIVARNSTKICCRTCETEMLVRRLKLLEEHYKYQCHLAWMEYLNNFKPFYFQLRNVISNLATVDCLISMATVSKANNYVKPIVSNSTQREIIIKNGYHPMVSHMLEPGKEFVRNDTTLSTMGESCMLISGANMGGKSAYIKQVAIVTLMAQMGCFVPADYASITPVDAIYVRCGVKDNIMQRKSAFYVEAEEMANVLHVTTPNSLLLVDEFGRCTSDSDGVNLVCGVIDYIITKLRCLALVVMSQCADIAKLEHIYPNKVACYHMAVIAPIIDGEEDRMMEEEQIVYLYELCRGVADKSYAIYVAKMAGIDNHILNSSFKKSKQMEDNKNHIRSSIMLFRKLLLTRGNYDRK